MAVWRKLSVLLLLLPVLALTGCIRYLADIEIIDEEHVTISFDIGMLISAQEELGDESPDLCASTALSSNPNAVLEPYTDDEYTGCRITFSGSVSDIATGNTHVELADGIWTFRQANDGEAGDADSAEMFSDFRISVTFPGEVLEHSGSSTVSGRTVTWTDPADFLAGSGVEATGRDGGGSGSTWVWWVVGIIGGLAVIAVAVVVVVQVRKPKSGPPGSHQPPAGPGNTSPPAGGAFPPGAPGQQPGGPWPPSPPANPFPH